MKRIKILALVPVWKRPEILLLFQRHLRRTIPEWVDLQSVYIVSPEDPELEAIKWLLKNEDVFYYKNNPLGEKMNAGVNYVKRYEFDYLMNIGSDNIFTVILWELYQQYFERDVDIFGINDFHSLNYDTGEFILIKNYNTAPDDSPAPIGAGRMIHKSILPSGDLYQKEWLWGMDGCSLFTLWELGYRTEVVETYGMAVMLNIMTRTNLTQWEEFQNPIECNRIKLRALFGLDSYKVMDDIPKHKIDCFNEAVNKNVSSCGSRKAAFEKVNEEYRQTIGETRFKNYSSFKVAVSKHYNK